MTHNNEIKPFPYLHDISCGLRKLFPALRGSVRHICCDVEVLMVEVGVCREMLEENVLHDSHVLLVLHDLVPLRTFNTPNGVHPLITVIQGG